MWQKRIHIVRDETKKTPTGDYLAALESIEAATTQIDVY